MARFRFDSKVAQGTLYLHLQGVFDGSSAWELRHALEGSDAGNIVLDFSGVDEAYEFGATVLGPGLRSLAGRSIHLIHVPEELHLPLERYHRVDDGPGPTVRIGVHPRGIPL